MGIEWNEGMVNGVDVRRSGVAQQKRQRQKRLWWVKRNSAVEGRQEKREGQGLWKDEAQNDGGRPDTQRIRDVDRRLMPQP